MRGGGESDKCEGEVTFQSVGDANDAAFSDEGVRGDGFFDGAG